MLITNTRTGDAFKLDPHQGQALQHLYDNPRAGLFLEMSLSKTIISLLYLYDMTYHEAAICKTLVIAPDKVARLTWPDEVKKWQEVSDYRYSIIDGDPEQRLAALNADAEIYFLPVQHTAWLVDQFIHQRVSKKTGKAYGPWLGSLPFDALVLDESTLFKNWSSERWKKLRRALDLSDIPYRIALTGTPSPNGDVDLWAQINLLDDGKRLAPTVGAYIDKYFNTRGNGMIIHEYITKAGAAKVIAHKISDIVIGMKTRDYMELPELIIDDIELEFDEYDREIYDELEREYLLEFLDSNCVTVKTPADLINKLLQVSTGAIYEDSEDGKSKKWHELNTLKMDALEDLVAQYPRENFLVIYQFRHELERIKKRFPYAVELPKGKKLNQVFEDWNAGRIKMLVIHPASAGHGLNLQFGGRRMVWTSPTWNLEHWLQTLARLLRRGALRRIFAHRLLVKGTKDIDVRRRVNSKDRNQEFLMKEVNALKRKYARKKQR